MFFENLGQLSKPISKNLVGNFNVFSSSYQKTRFQTAKFFNYTIHSLELNSQNCIEKLLCIGITLHKTEALFKTNPISSKLTDKL